MIPRRAHINDPHPEICSPIPTCQQPGYRLPRHPAERRLQPRRRLAQPRTAPAQAQRSQSPRRPQQAHHRLAAGKPAISRRAIPHPPAGSRAAKKLGKPTSGYSKAVPNGWSALHGPVSKTTHPTRPRQSPSPQRSDTPITRPRRRELSSHNRIYAGPGGLWGQGEGA